jgi:anti-sigma regulatory factor (Ser/Thr protein kinase)
MTRMLVRREPISASVIRRTLADDLAPHAIDETSLHEVTLVATELVGNAIRHGGAADSDGVDVTWTIDSGSVTIVVADPSATRPEPRSAAPDAEGGRGLTIVAALSDEWGVDADDRGKRVWARIPIRRA